VREELRELAIGQREDRWALRGEYEHANATLAGGDRRSDDRADAALAVSLRAMWVVLVRLRAEDRLLPLEGAAGDVLPGLDVHRLVRVGPPGPQHPVVLLPENDPRAGPGRRGRA